MSDWQEYRIGDHINPISGFPFASDKFTSDEGVPLIRIRDLVSSETEVNYSGKYSDAFLVENGDVLIGMDGDFNIVKWKGGRALLNQRLLKLIERPKSELALEYIFYWLIPYLLHVNNITAATTVKHLSTSDVTNAIVKGPGREEQQKIAKILTTVDNLIEKTEALIEKYQAIKQGMMHDLFSRGIDTNGQLRPSHHDAPHLYKQTELGWIPKEWPIEKLGSMAEISSGITLGKNHTGPETIVVPYLRVANVQDGYLDLTEVKTIRIPKAELGKVLLERGDVLMNEGGDFDKLGRGTIWRNEIEGCAHQNHVFKVRTDKAKLDPEFLAYWSASSFGKKYFVLSSKQSTNLASINSTQLKAFTIVAPAINEQQGIVERLSSIDSMLSKLNSQNGKHQKLKKGLMQDLLTGKVRVMV